MAERAENWVVDKGLMRVRLLAQGLSRVGTLRTTLDRLTADLDGHSYPCVVKPVSLGASMCVELLRGPADLAPYVCRCRANRVFADEELVVEDYVPGPELSVEGVVADGTVTFYGITESHHSGEPYFVGTGHDFFPAHEQAAPITAFVRQVIGALEMDDCLFHIELKCLPAGYEVIEVHSRFGGTLIAELVRLGTGAEVFADHVRALAGEEVAVPQPWRAGLYGQHMLCSPPGRIRVLALAEGVTADERVLAYGLDHSAGDVVEADVLPVQYVGHVIFAVADREGAAAVRARCEQGLIIELDPIEPVATSAGAVAQ
jgi:biotin carboxylase